MNPVWAIFFKDRFRTPFSVYKMSLAELVVLLSMFVGFGYGCFKGVNWIVDFETSKSVLDE
jgi:hypothetical protein